MGGKSMSDLKFECPSCNQRMECDRALGGDVIHCPKCCAELRIPFPTPHSLPGSVQRAELLHPATGPANTPAPASSQTAQLAANPTSASASLDSAEAICPVCHSQLRFKGAKATGSAGAPLGTAELVRRPEDHALDHCKEKAE